MRKFLLGFAAAVVLMSAATAGAVAEKVLRVGVGDVVFVTKTKISCSVANPYKQMVCFKHNKRGGAVPNTYGATVANGFAGLVKFNSKGKPKMVVRKANP